MSLSVESIKYWSTAVEKCDSKDYNGSLATFLKISDKSSKILYNLGCLSVLLDKHEAAIQYFSQALERDPRFAVALFQRAFQQFKAHRFSKALVDYSSVLELFPESSTIISYYSGQLAMRTQLNQCQVFHNLALCYIHLGDKTTATTMLTLATKCGCNNSKKHDYVKDSVKAIKNNAYFDPMKVSIDRLYRPAKSLISSTVDINFLGKEGTKVIAAKTTDDKIVGFMGPHFVAEHKKMLISSSVQKDSPQDSTEEKSSLVNRLVLPTSAKRSTTPSPPRPPPPNLKQRSLTPPSNDLKNSHIPSRSEFFEKRPTPMCKPVRVAPPLPKEPTFCSSLEDVYHIYEEIIEPDGIYTEVPNDVQTSNQNVSAAACSHISSQQTLGPPSRPPPRLPQDLRNSRHLNESTNKSLVSEMQDKLRLKFENT